MKIYSKKSEPKRTNERAKFGAAIISDKDKNRDALTSDEITRLISNNNYHIKNVTVRTRKATIMEHVNV